MPTCNTKLGANLFWSPYSFQLNDLVLQVRVLFNNIELSSSGTTIDKQQKHGIRPI
jgi:hypothetical protein